MHLNNIYFLHEVGGKKNQEDFIWPAPGDAVLHDRVFVVCDGVGGSANGEVASRLIASATGEALSVLPETELLPGRINRILQEAQTAMAAHATTTGISKDMATTICLLVFSGHRALIAWCGDSRVYHVRKGEILFKTADHSLVNTLVKNGEITEDEALTHPQRHIILKAINGDETPAEAESHWIESIAPGDYFLLCTDGLLENITEADIKTLLNGERTRAKDIISIIQERCFGKTKDNYSLYLLQTALPVTAQKIRPSKTPLLLLLAAVLLAAGVYFYNAYRHAPTVIPAAFNTDTSTRPLQGANNQPAVRKDSLPYTELENQAGETEKKISPPPLPAGASGHKITPRGKRDTVQLNPSTLQKNQPPQEKPGSKTDSH
jgi:PPM family protein phosphatase